MQIKQEVVIPEVFCRESKLKDNGSSTSNLEDDVYNEILSTLHSHKEKICSHIFTNLTQFNPL